MTLPELFCWLAALAPFAFWLFMSRTRGVGICLAFWTLLLGVFLVLANQMIASGATSLVLSGFLAGAVLSEQRKISLGTFELGSFTIFAAFCALGAFVMLPATGVLLVQLLGVSCALAVGQLCAMNAYSLGLLKIEPTPEF